MHTLTDAKPAHPLRLYRVARGMSQKAVAEASGVSRATVIRIEAGEPPSTKTANALANVLEVDRVALFGGDS